jgi:hypothetical protein
MTTTAAEQAATRAWLTPEKGHGKEEGARLPVELTWARMIGRNCAREKRAINSSDQKPKIGRRMRQQEFRKERRQNATCISAAGSAAAHSPRGHQQAADRAESGEPIPVEHLGHHHGPNPLCCESSHERK